MRYACKTHLRNAVLQDMLPKKLSDGGVVLMNGRTKDVGAVRKRRYRAAVYSVCGGLKDVDRAFDALISLMLSERREDHYWGVMLDHAPSPLFRAFGDGEIEARIKKRFSELCESYPFCGFFCILRGRRYGAGRVFMCENGLGGALRLLAGGRGEGAALRLNTGDTVEHSERVFVYCLGREDGISFFPGTVSDSACIEGAVAFISEGDRGFAAKRRFLKSVNGNISENYHVCGWFPLVFSQRCEISEYRREIRYPYISGRVKKSFSDTERGRHSVAWEGMETAIICAEKGCGVFERNSDGATLYAESAESEADILAWRSIASIALYSLGRLDSDIFIAFAEDCVRRIGELFCRYDICSPGYIRISLLFIAAFCRELCIYQERAFIAADAATALAEKMRIAYESGESKLRTPLAPCEALAFRCFSERGTAVFRGFTALNRLCDCFLYLVVGDERAINGMGKDLFFRGFGRCGIMAAGGAHMTANCLALAFIAEKRLGTFSKAFRSEPELFSVSPVVNALPEEGWRSVFDRMGRKRCGKELSLIGGGGCFVKKKQTNCLFDMKISKRY